MKATTALFEQADRILNPDAFVTVRLNAMQAAFVAFLIELKYDEIRCAGASGSVLETLVSIDNAVADGVHLAINAEIERQGA